MGGLQCCGLTSNNHENEPSNNTLASARIEQAEDKGHELQNILLDYSKAVQKYQQEQIEKHKQMHLHTQRSNSADNIEEDLIPSVANNIILILGQMLLPDGSPHRWMLQRCEGAVNLIASKNLDINKTYFVVSGSDVSNQKYTYNDKYKNSYINSPHQTEAETMKNILIKKYNINADNIILEPDARTTLENAYYFLKLLLISGFYLENQEKNEEEDKTSSNTSYKLDNVFIVTSDWHTRRIKFNMDALYSIEKELIEDRKTIEDDDDNVEYFIKKFEVCRWFKSKNIEYIGIESDVTQKKLDGEDKLLKSKFLKPQANEYCNYLWDLKSKVINGDSNKIGSIYDEFNTTGLFAKSTAIELMYLKLDNAREGLMKIPNVIEHSSSESESDSEYHKN